MRRSLFPGIVLAVCTIPLAHAQQRPAARTTPIAPPALPIYAIDVEGGQSTLFVAPDGETLLIDTGWPGFNSRDAGRILAALHDAGATKIDNLVITHYHIDHVGGVPQLAAKVPIGRFIDHGINREDASVEGGPDTVAAWNTYQKLVAEGHSQHLVVKPGDTLPTRSFRAEVVSADTALITKPLISPGAGAPNPACAASPLKQPEHNENDDSLGLVITFGGLRILDLGDLTWAIERGLVCPSNLLGTVDLMIVSHHGLARSNSPALIHAVAPRVAVIDNGAHKGAAAATFDVLQGSNVQNVWQLHTAEANDAAHNAPSEHIANLAGTPDHGYWLQLDARRDGSISVHNPRTGAQVDYPAR